MDIGVLSVRDLPDLARLYQQFRGEKSSLEDMGRVFRSLETDTNYTLLGARERGTLVGSVIGILCRELYGQCRPFMVVEDVIVDRAHRRRGIGSELMRRIEQVAIQKWCSYLMLVTDVDRTGALGFYEHLGYHPDRYRACKKYMDIAKQ